MASVAVDVDNDERSTSTSFSPSSVSEHKHPSIAASVSNVAQGLPVVVKVTIRLFFSRLSGPCSVLSPFC
jgi:hypothetical protein